jgi:hypothetical protein
MELRVRSYELDVNVREVSGAGSGEERKRRNERGREGDDRS